ncbi:MAG: hypothetical protein WD766_00520 [Gemmatimonadota bacterium]
MTSRIRVLLPSLLVLFGSACQTTSEPERREIRGSWASVGVPGVEIEMTLAETARSIDGAGAWKGPETARAFLVRGALAVDEVSLNFDFSGTENVNFQGHFSDEDTMVGVLNGGGLRDEAGSFTRVDRLP